MSRTPKWDPRFLEAYKLTMNIKVSCQTADISRAQYYRRRAACEGFAVRCDQAKEDALDALEAIARQRALSGASDRLIEFLLKAHRPDVYGDRVQVTHLRDRAKTLGDELGLDPAKIIERAEQIARGEG